MMSDLYGFTGLPQSFLLSNGPSRSRFSEGVNREREIRRALELPRWKKDLPAYVSDKSMTPNTLFHMEYMGDDDQSF